MAKQLLAAGLSPDVILGSSAVRVQETLQLMRRDWARGAEVFVEKSLYLASAQELAAAVQGLHESWHTAMLVGHNPGISAFASWLSGSSLELPTAAVVVFRSQATSWQAAVAGGGWELHAEWRPRELEEI